MGVRKSTFFVFVMLPGQSGFKRITFERANFWFSGGQAFFNLGLSLVGMEYADLFFRGYLMEERDDAIGVKRIIRFFEEFMYTIFDEKERGV